MRKSLWVLLGLSVVLCTLLLFRAGLSLIFTEIGHNNRITFYSESDNEKAAADSILKRVDQLLARSQYFSSARTNVNVYLTGSYNTYTCVALTSWQSFAVHNYLGVFISKSSVAQDSVWRNATTYHRRRLSCVIAHELVHQYLGDELGFFRYHFELPSWKNEGLADYIANESSFPYAEGMRRMASHSANTSNSYLYFKYRIVTSFVLGHEGMSITQFLSDTNTFEYWLDHFQRNKP